MGRSVGLPSVFTEGRIVHKLSGSTVTIRQRGSPLEHELERRGVVAEYPVAYSVGAGIVGYSYMVRLGKIPVSIARFLLHTNQELGPDAGLRDGIQPRFHTPDLQRLPFLPHRRP